VMKTPGAAGAAGRARAVNGMASSNRARSKSQKGRLWVFMIGCPREWWVVKAGEPDAAAIDWLHTDSS
jgi:hypothetical protein